MTTVLLIAIIVVAIWGLLITFEGILDALERLCRWWDKRGRR